MIKKWAWFISDTAEAPVKRVTLGFQGIEPLFVQVIEHVGRPKRTRTVDGKKKQILISDEEYEAITNVFNIASACTEVCGKYHWSTTSVFFGMIFEKMGYQKAHQRYSLDASDYIVELITAQIVQDGIIDHSYRMFNITDYNEFWEQSEAYSVVLDMMFAAASISSFQHIDRAKYYEAFREMLEFVPKDTTEDTAFVYGKTALLRTYISEIQKVDEQ